MSHTPSNKSPRRRPLALAALLVAGSFLSGSPAPALPSPIELHRELHQHLRHVVRDAIRVPREIHRSHLRALRPYFSGRSYYRPHRHHHAIYRFPVRAHGHLIHRHYAYCNGHLFGRAH